MKVAFLTAGGIAPCLSASIGRLIRNYSDQGSNIQMMAYLHGYKGLLTDKSINIDQNIIDNAKNKVIPSPLTIVANPTTRNDA